MKSNSGQGDDAYRRREIRNEALRTSAVITERADKGPMRPVGRRRGRRPGGLYYSAKMGRMVAWESKAERDAFFYPEIFPEVVDYREQPHTAAALINGQKRVYTPDRMDVLADRTIVIVEVKDAFEAEADPDYAMKLAFFGEIYRAIGWRFEVVDRAAIESQASFEAIKKVQSHRRVSFDAAELASVMAILRSGASTVGGLLPAFSNPLAGEAKLCAMMVHGHIRIDLDDPFRLGSAVAAWGDVP